MTEHLPLVSIITPCYNSASFIGDTIKSVLMQTYKNWEMLIIDDCSTDGSCDTVETFIKKSKKIKIIKLNKNLGVANARNVGIQAAKGRFIAFLDSDDLWALEKLSRQISFMLEKHAVVSCTAYSKIDENGLPLEKVIYPPGEITYSTLLYSNVIGCLTAIFDANETGKLMMTEVGHEDYAFWLRLLKRGYIAYGLQEDLAKYRSSKNSLSRNKFKTAMFQWNIYRNIEKLNFMKSMFYFIHYIWYGFQKL